MRSPMRSLCRRLFSFAIPLLAGCSSVKSDFEKICDNAKKMKPEGALATSEFYLTTAKELKNEKTQFIWKTMPLGEPEARYQLLTISAKEVGESNFECESLKPHLSK